MKRTLKMYIFLCLSLLLFSISAFAATTDDTAKPIDALRKTEGTTEPAQDAYYMDVLAQTSTPLINKMPNRTDNIILTCKMINETALIPGDTFSFNQIVGNRTRERGFKPAPTFVNGQVEDSIGGGICQVSSTLYYTCLLSNLEIVSRTSHSMSPDYLEQPGFDATVCWEAIDYKFKNNTNGPIKIFTWTDGSKVYVKIMGTKMNNNTVVMESKILLVTPFKTIYRDNPNLACGETKVVQPPFTGYEVETYRVITDERGEIISRVLESKDSYKKMDKVIERSPYGSPTNTQDTSIHPLMKSPSLILYLCLTPYPEYTAICR